MRVFFSFTIRRLLVLTVPTLIGLGSGSASFAAEPFEMLPSDVAPQAVQPFQILDSDVQPAGLATVYNGTDSAGSAALTNNSGDSVTFNDESSASSATIINNTGGATAFNDQSTAASSFITNNAGTSLKFNDESTAADSRITNNGGGSLGFNGNSTAGNAVITNNGTATFNDNATADNSLMTNNGSGLIEFNGNANAGHRNLTNNGAVAFADDSSASDVRLENNLTGTVEFQDRATAATADINNSGSLSFAGASTAAQSDIINNNSGQVAFRGDATAGQSNITNSGALSFSGASNAESSALINNAGALIGFSDQSSANAAFIVNAGTLDFSGSSTAFASTITTSIGGITRFSDLAEGGTATLQLDQGSTFDVSGISDGRIGLGSFTSAGAVNLARTQITLSGSAVLNDTSNLVVTLGYGQLIANSIELQGGTLELERGEIAYGVGQTYRILQAVSFTGSNFDSAIDSDFAFLTPRLSDQGDTITLDRNGVTFASAAQTRNQLAVAIALDATPQNSAIYTAVVGGTAADALYGFDQLSGEIHVTAPSYLWDNSRLLRNIVLERARTMSTARRDDNRWQSWIAGLGSTGNFDGDGNAASASAQSYGAAAGVERLFEYDVAAGVAASYEHGTLEAAERNSEADVDTLGVAIYGSWQPSQFGLRVGAAYQNHQLDMTRDIDLPGLNAVASSDDSGWTGQVFAEAGYALKIGQAEVEPFAGVVYGNTSLDTFRETGAGDANLDVSSTSNDGTIVRAGVRTKYDFILANGYGLTAGVSAAWNQTLFGRNPRQVAFLGGMPFNIYGPSETESQLELGASADLAVSNALILKLVYDGLLSSTNASHAINVGATLKF